MIVTDPSTARLHGPWLMAARVAWIALVVLTVGVVIAAVLPGFEMCRRLAQAPDFSLHYLLTLHAPLRCNAMPLLKSW